MTYVYVANAPEDRDFARRLSGDLQKKSINHWYDDGGADEATVYAHLQQATHILVVLSPAVMLNERVLAALEHARQQHLTRLAVRIHPMETMPPQIQGILPLNAADDDHYGAALETLFEDLQPPTTTPRSELPEELMTAIYSENVAIRKNAIQALMQYQDEEEPLKTLALDELRALVFRERDSAMKVLLRSAIQSYELDERPTQPKMALPSKEELAQQAAGRAVIIEPEKVMYFWQSPRWHVLLGGVGLLLGGVVAWVGGHWGYALPILLVSLVLPQLNIAIRNNGELEWQNPGSLVGNTFLAVLSAMVLAGMLFLALPQLDPLWGGASIALGGVLGGVIGWLSGIKVLA